MYYIVIREQRENDVPQISELVRNAYASNIPNMFFGCLFAEATIQLIVIFSAILFIFFQVPLWFCPVTVPIVLGLIYAFIYIIITMKSAQVMYDKRPIISWVAETYEPYFHTKNPNTCWYKIISQQEWEELKDKPEGRRRIVGTIGLMQHLQEPQWCWLYRLAVDSRYRRKGIGTNLVTTVQDWCRRHQIDRIELAMSEYNEGARELFDKAGFQIKHFYHKKQVGSFYTVQMYVLTVEGRPTFN